jgi:hypothetical protein
MNDPERPGHSKGVSKLEKHADKEMNGSGNLLTTP